MNLSKSNKMNIKTINSLTLFFVFFVLLFTSIGYSALSANLKISGDVDFNYDPGSTLADVFKTTNPLVIEYKGEGWVGGTNPYFTNHIYHWYVPNGTYNGHTAAENAATVKDSWNVVFGGFCWQMVRTTESGGVRLLYNGEPIVGTSGGNTTYNCSEVNRKTITHVGFDSYRSNVTGFSSSTAFKYGTSYTVSGSTFTIGGTTTSSKWTSTTANNLKGKFTCKNSGGTCTTMYLIDGYNTTTSAWAFPISTNSEYNMIGNSTFNSSYNSPAYLGYMYNYISTITDNYYIVWTNDTTYATSAGYTYNSSTNKFNLDSNALAGVNDFSNIQQMAIFGLAPYMCLENGAINGGTSNCSSLAYVYNIDPSSRKIYYIDYGELYKSMYKSDVNTNSSSIKQVVDAWYKINISGKTFESKIDTNEIYCNDRSMGDITTGSNSLTVNFHGLGSTSVSINSSSVNVYNLSCPNKLDAFSKTATAKGNGALTYPTGLMSYAEMQNLGNNEIRVYNPLYMGADWLITPGYLSISTNGNNSATGYTLYSTGDINPTTMGVSSDYGVRPSIALIEGTKFTTGDGSEINPYVVDISS